MHSEQVSFGAAATLEQADSVELPTGLKPVLDIIPPRCRERSTARGLGILARDFTLYALCVWGLLSTNNVFALVALWIAAGSVVAGLFVLGHDAAHDALFDSKKLNAVVARLAMVPSLHAAEVWVYGHNRVHHGHTVKQGVDFVWHPVTVSQYEEMSRLGRLRHRFEWGPFGAGAYYLRDVWWNKMIRFPPPARWRSVMRRDKVIVLVAVVLALALFIGFQGWAGIWVWTKVVVIPFLLFCQAIGWVVYVQHVDQNIKWWPRHDWNRFRGQVEGTTILHGPPGWDLLFHWIMVHVPHHVDMSIPCYRLPLAAEAIVEAFPGAVTERRISVADYLRTTRDCKLYDFEVRAWSRYPSLTRT